MTSWLHISRTDLIGRSAEHIASLVRERAVGRTIGAAFRDGVRWDRAERWFRCEYCIRGSDDRVGRCEHPPFAVPPLSLHDQLDSPDCLMSRGMAALAAGDWERGWRLYEWRTQAEHWRRHWWRPYGMPIWDGKPLNGRRLLITTEQGAGDVFMFARYLNYLPAGVTFACAPNMLSLIRRSFPHVNVIASVSQDFDRHLPLMSLPIALDMPEPFEAGAYLVPDEDRVTEYRARLFRGDRKPTVGVCWRGNPNHMLDAQRSMTLNEIMAHVPAGARVVSLQERAVRDPTGELIQWGHEFENWDVTAALIANLDRVISVDTAVAHLAAAMGVPTTLIIPRGEGEWRWRSAKWYEAMEIIRPPNDPAWETKHSRRARAAASAIPRT